MLPPVNFRNNNNLRNGPNNNNPPMKMNFAPMQGRRGPQMNMPPMVGPPMGPIPPQMNMRGGGGGPPMRRPFPKCKNNNMKNNSQNRKNPNLTKVDKPKHRKPQNANKKNGNNRAKKRQRDPYSLDAPFVTDAIREEHKKKEDILESLKGKGKNDELFAKFKEQRDIFVKKYDEAKVTYQAEKKAQREADKAAKAEEAAKTAQASTSTETAAASTSTETAAASTSTDTAAASQPEGEITAIKIETVTPLSEIAPVETVAAPVEVPAPVAAPAAQSSETAPTS